jgi:hemin uptake protein HemP
MAKAHGANHSGKDSCDEGLDSKCAPPTFSFESLSQGETVVLITLNDQTYQLRKTKNGKLILYK